MGFTQTAVPFHREARSAGETKYTLPKMLRFSFDAITSFSSTPLQWATFLGFAFAGLAFLGIPLTIVARYTHVYERGVPSTILIILLLGGIQLITVGIIGEYVGRIYDEVKHRPLQFATLLGFFFSALAFLAIPLTIVARYAEIYERGVPTTIVIVLLLGGIQLITVGIIGEYVGRIYDEVKHRPLYVVGERINIEEPAER